MTDTPEITEPEMQPTYVEAIVNALIDAGHEPDEVTALDLLDVLATCNLKLVPDFDSVSRTAYLLAAESLAIGEDR